MNVIDEIGIYRESSNVAETYYKHVSAMEPTKNLPEKASFAIAPRAGLSLEFLIDIAKNFEADIVVIEHDDADCFEVCRLKDGSNVNWFYKHCVKPINKPTTIVDCVNKVKQAITYYLDNKFEKCFNYDKQLTKELKDCNVITHAFIQRKVGNLKAFTKAPEGGPKRLKECIAILIQGGHLLERDNEGAKQYQIVDSSKGLGRTIKTLTED